jgi:cardiolipin synthase
VAYAALVLQWTLAGIFGIAAIVGLLFITRGTAVRRVRAVGVDGSPVAPAEAAFPLSVAILTGSSLTAGNKIELVLDGEIFPRLWEDLRSARTAITVQMYFANAGRVVNTLGEILIERARAGVRVYVLYDAFGAKALGGDFAKALRDAGARVVPFRPLRFANLWVIQNRSHIRGVVIDSQIGWTGGFGFDDKWLGTGRAGTGWRDTNIRFEGPAVLEMIGAFISGWAEATGELFTGRRSEEHERENVALANVLHTSPNLGSTAAERYLALSIAGAQKSLLITNAYFAPDENFVALLVDAARRGVDVQLLVGGARTDVRVARLAAHGRYEKLLEAGVRIYEYQPTTLHAKTFVADGIWSSVGTMNFDNRSLALNDEVTFMVLHAAFGERMEAIFRADIRNATVVDHASFKQRPMFEHIKEWAANQIIRLL